MREREISMIGYYDFSAKLTYLSVVSAMFGIFFALNQNVKFAVVCLMVSGICDMLDGPIARMKKNRSDDEKSYGIQIDSLSDVVSFGILPAIIGYAVGLDQLWHVAVMSLYVLTAVIRLAFFNVAEMKLQKGNVKRTHYIGLPVTFAAIIFPAVYLAQIIFAFENLTIVYAVTMVILSIAFVAKVKLPKIRLRYLIALAVLSIPAIIFIVIWRSSV